MAVGMESRRRSMVKAATWRIVALVITMLVSFMWLGEWTTSIALALAANGIKALLYYLHERIWDRTDFGRKKIEEDYVI